MRVEMDLEAWHKDDTSPGLGNTIYIYNCWE